MHVSASMFCWFFLSQKCARILPTRPDTLLAQSRHQVIAKGQLAKGQSRRAPPLIAIDLQFCRNRDAPAPRNRCFAVRSLTHLRSRCVIQSRRATQWQTTRPQSARGSAPQSVHCTGLQPANRKSSRTIARHAAAHYLNAERTARIFVFPHCG